MENSFLNYAQKLFKTPAKKTSSQGSEDKKNFETSVVQNGISLNFSVRSHDRSSTKSRKNFKNMENKKKLKISSHEVIDTELQDLEAKNEIKAESNKSLESFRWNDS